MSTFISSGVAKSGDELARVSECVRWMQKLGQFNGDNAEKPTDLLGLARCLQSGEALCDLLFHLQPESMDLSQVYRRTTSTILHLKNVRLFLQSCRRFFGLSDAQIFDEYALMFYRNLPSVLQTLEALRSNKHPTSSRNNRTHAERTEKQFSGSRLDASDLQPMERSSLPPLSNELNAIISKLYLNEERYVFSLKTIWQDFLVPLNDVIQELDWDLFCQNISDLIDLHSTILATFQQAYMQTLASHAQIHVIVRIFRMFDSIKADFTYFYNRYFSLIDYATSMCKEKKHLSAEREAFHAKLVECKRQSVFGNFKLHDLLLNPLINLFKYYAVFSKLIKFVHHENDRSSTANRTTISDANLIYDIYEVIHDLCNYFLNLEREKENEAKLKELRVFLGIQNEENFLGCTFNDLGFFMRLQENVSFKYNRIKQMPIVRKHRTVLLFAKSLVVFRRRTSSLTRQLVEPIAATYEFEFMLPIDSHFDVMRSIQPISLTSHLNRLFLHSRKTVQIKSTIKHRYSVSSDAYFFTFDFKKKIAMRMWSNALSLAANRGKVPTPFSNSKRLSYS